MMTTGNLLPTHAIANDALEKNIEDIPLLPPPSGEASHKITLGETLKLDHLGPIIINTDGTTRRIENWDTLTKAEQANTWRLISARNQKRIEVLKKQLEEAKEKGESEAEEQESSSDTTSAEEVTKSQE